MQRFNLQFSHPSSHCFLPLRPMYLPEHPTIKCGHLRSSHNVRHLILHFNLYWVKKRYYSAGSLVLIQNHWYQTWKNIIIRQMHCDARTATISDSRPKPCDLRVLTVKWCIHCTQHLLVTVHFQQCKWYWNIVKCCTIIHSYLTQLHGRRHGWDCFDWDYLWFVVMILSVLYL
jgi:hypothetical protein